VLVPARKPLPSGGLGIILSSFSITEEMLLLPGWDPEARFPSSACVQCVVVVQQVTYTFLQALLLKKFPPT